MNTRNNEEINAQRRRQGSRRNQQRDDRESQPWLTNHQTHQHIS
jgi:hypothetical protein